MKHILWLTSWYPDNLDKFDGDFIQRHARAVALYCKVHVIYVKKDGRLASDEVASDIQEKGNLTEQIIYYNHVATGIKLLDKFLSQRKFNKLSKWAVKEYIKVTGKPDIVHVHIAMKAGITALWIKHKWNIPFIVSEHWTGYLPNADLQFQSFPFLYKSLLKKVLQQASMLTVVSEHLGQAVQHHFPAIKYQVIPNVIDTDIFFPEQKPVAAKTRFIHISNMNYQKNTEAILEATHLLKAELQFEMYLYGTDNPQIHKLIDNYALQNHVFIKGEVDQTELAEAVRQSDALVLYSRFETFGCVIIEANACGIPVIVSNLEVFHELVEENVNGIFSPGENPQALAQKLKEFVLQKDTFVKNEIAGVAAKKYNYKTVGQQFFQLYNKINN